MANKKYKPTGETHILTTVEDISKIITTENYPYLMKDIATCFAMLCDLKKGGVTMEKIQFKSIKWTDDGKNELTGITFSPIVKKKTATKRQGL
ncbi:MAG: hypothetical protein V4547_18140 [Bacteroidota bacterium]